jgi:hypothetical protein
MKTKSKTKSKILSNEIFEISAPYDGLMRIKNIFDGDNACMVTISEATKFHNMLGEFLDLMPTKTSNPPSDSL